MRLDTLAQRIGLTGAAKRQRDKLKKMAARLGAEIEWDGPDKLRLTTLPQPEAMEPVGAGYVEAMRAHAADLDVQPPNRVIGNPEADVDDLWAAHDAATAKRPEDNWPVDCRPAFHDFEYNPFDGLDALEDASDVRAQLRDASAFLKILRDRQAPVPVLERGSDAVREMRQMLHAAEEYAWD